MFVVAAVELEAVRQLVGGVRFAQAAEAAQSVQSKPPEAAMGSSGSDSDTFQCPENFLAEVRSPHRRVEVSGIQFAMILLSRSGSPAAVVGTGPAGTQRLRCRRAGSGVGAEYAPTPLVFSLLAWAAHKLHGYTMARLRGQAQPGANPPAAPERAARPNPSLKRSANGRPPGPGPRYGVHFLSPGPGVLPSSPA